MKTATYDPAYLSEQLKFLRSHHRLTQANVAELAGLTTRTIEKLESGRHHPDVQTMRSLCRALHISEDYFVKPSPEQQAATRHSMERALRSTVVIPLTPAVSVQAISSAMSGFDGWRMDGAVVTDECARATMSALFDLIFDFSEVWDDIGHVERHEAMKAIHTAARELEMAGHRLYLGSYRQLHQSRKPPLALRYGLAVVLTIKDHDQTRHALVTLEEPWEAHPNDRIASTESNADVPESQSTSTSSAR